MSKLHELHQLGQSTWLNYMHRSFIKAGGLRKCIQKGIQGITANAAVFDDCIANESDYDDAIREQIVAGTPYRRIHRELMIDDVQRAADIFHPVYEESNGLNGYASLELDPSLANDTVNTVATALSILAGIDRGNAMVEVPSTLAGCEAIRTLTSDGVSLNATHLFSIGDFERAAQAYICGLEIYVDTHSVWRKAPMAVASFSVGAIDREVEPLLAAQGRTDLQGKTGIALAKLLYERYQQIFSGPRWERLAKKGARPLRPKWTRIHPANGAYPLTHYVNALIGADTVITFTRDTLDAFMAEGRVAETITEDVVGARAHMANLAAEGIDLDALVYGLQEKYLAISVEQYQQLIDSVLEKLYQVGDSEPVPIS